MFPNSLKDSWFSNVRGDLLAGIVVALALIPEAIAFSIIAGVDPKIGLYASFTMAVIISFTGGRPGMISAATGAMALLLVTLVKNHGLEYMLAATLLTGVIQIILGLLKVASIMRFVSKAVMAGFVNALAILIFMAQLPELKPRPRRHQLDHLRDGRRRTWHHLSVPAPNKDNPLAARLHHRPDRPRHFPENRCLPCW
jgi:SulP family sulfate permease